MDNSLTVSQLNKYLKGLLEKDYILRNVSVHGEISTITKHRSGHYYFNLKDEFSSISCVMFASDAKKVQSDLNSGDEIIVKGRLSVYEARGVYQIYVSEVMTYGLGALFLKLEQTKKKLELEGLFDTSKKKKLPFLPSRIGIVTSPSGAAIKDITKIAGERNDSVQLLLYGSLVQGAGAAKTIVKGIEYFNNTGDVDIIIVTRGGGSQLDLMPFNEENVARAIYESKIPIVSAVGHERDTSISDLVCDVRAATPSDAALICIKEKSELMELVDYYKSSLVSKYSQILSNKNLMINSVKSEFELCSPKSRLQHKVHTIIERESSIKSSIEMILLKKNMSFVNYTEKLDALSPLSRLKSGYSYVYKDNKPLKSAANAKEDDELSIIMYDGKINTKVLEVIIDAKKK